jgi:hypothetical protein
MSYWSQADLEGLIGDAAVEAIFDPKRNGFVDPQILAEVQALADTNVDAVLARTYPGPFPIFQVIPTWAANQSYAVGQMVIPTVASGYAFRCVGLAGNSGGVQPTWPTQYGQTVTDGQVTWLCASTVPELIRHASLLFGKALAYQRSPEYTKRYGSKPMEEAEAYCQRLTQAESYLTDLIGTPQPSNVGGIVYAHGPRMTVDRCDGTGSCGDF